MIRLMSWNMAHRDLWGTLGETDADVALLQEAAKPRPGAALEVLPSEEGDWTTAGWPTREWRTAVARLTDRVALNSRPTSAMHEVTGEQDWAVGRQGTITAADVLVDGRVAFTVVSVYAPWDRTPTGGLYADASAHRVLSDLSALMYTTKHRLVVAGDWNILCGYGEHGDTYYAARYATVFARAEALGLTFVGPQAPHGRQAEPWPAELPKDSLCVPTYHHSRQRPETATRQLDFVFASSSIADRVRTRALNGVDEWGGSDHCRVLIDVDL